VDLDGPCPCGAHVLASLHQDRVETGRVEEGTSRGQWVPQEATLPGTGEQGQH
jgi:hypothetical protein